MEPLPASSGVVEVAPRHSPVSRSHDSVATPDPSASSARPRAAGKFLFTGDEKLWVRGVTYGTFRPDRKGWGLPPPEVVERDFDLMAANGVNAVRLYSVPPRRILDEAWKRGLRLMIGLPWEQHVAFLDDAEAARSILERVRAGVASCAGHPAVLCYAVGNEIPPSIVRWSGARRVERYIRHLYDVAKAEDPEALVTYVNFPSTEYLELPFLDLVCFNVYLERTDRLERYLARLQNLAGDRPLVLSELGHDSRRHGERQQAGWLREQLPATFASGCAGAFVFAWTDEWHRGGYDVDDWDFGLTSRDRRPKPALSVVRRVFASAPFPIDTTWPPVTVVVCVHNGETTLEDCLTGISQLAYPHVELVVVDDGSTDRSAEIASRFSCRLIRTPNRGLSAARNTGLAAATGDIVAYIDADARPDSHWLHYLVEALRNGEYVGAGGPNLPCPQDGEIAACVGNAPGGPTHVLLSDTEAEHIPGCNMAFRRQALEAIRGFDPRFRVAGDDVDVCWRLQQRGWKLGFAASSVVWHHQRSSVRGYWRQQTGYGRAEALLERKWPEKYNAIGQVAWSGRIYAAPLLYMLSTSRVYHGTWGTALFQHRHSQPGLLLSLAGTPEWNLVLGVLLVLSLVGITWSPLLLALPLLLGAAAVSLSRALRGALQARFRDPAASRWAELRRRARTAFLFLAQPAARLVGRLSDGLTPWRQRRPAPLAWPWQREVGIWSERWREPTRWLVALERRLHERRAVVQRGGPYDNWDLEARSGPWSVARVRMCWEDHGSGRQLVRFRVWSWSRTTGIGWALAASAALLAFVAAADGARLASVGLVTAAAAFAALVFRQSAVAVGLVLGCLEIEHLVRGDAVLVLPQRQAQRETPSRGAARARRAG